MTDENNLSAAILPLIKGYKQFKEKNFENTKVFENLVKHGQKPKVLIIACCDSRVDPAIITNCNAGKLFVVRNVANLVPPFDGDHHHHGTSAALEYGVLNLEVSDIIVFGHSHCGGIASLMSQEENKNSSDFIATWMDIAKPAKEKILQNHPTYSYNEKAALCEKESLLISLKNLKTFPWIQERLLTNKLSIHAWYFDLSTGEIKTYNTLKKEFIPLIYS